jgi:peroxiredoxin
MSRAHRGPIIVRYGLAVAIVAVVVSIFLQSEIRNDDAKRIIAENGSVIVLGPVDDRSVALNEPAPDFVLEVLGGEPVLLSDFHGKTVVLNFWASWCPPCREEMGEFQKLWAQRGPEGSDDLVILAIDVLQNDTIVAAAGLVEALELTFPILFDTEDGDVTVRYGVRALPATFFIDRRGVVRSVNLGPVFGTILSEGVAGADAGGM